MKDLTFTTLNGLNAKDYYSYVTATNAFITILTDDETNGITDLTNVFEAVSNTVRLPADSSGYETYLESIFDIENPVENIYQTNLSINLQSGRIGEKLHAIFASSVYQTAFETMLADLAPEGDEFDEAPMASFMDLYTNLTSATGFQDPNSTSNYFRLPSYNYDTPSNISDGDFLIVDQSLFKQLHDAILPMAKNAGDKAEEFTTDLIHMIM
jgi:hypothetical protein